MYLDQCHDSQYIIIDSQKIKNIIKLTHHIADVLRHYLHVLLVFLHQSLQDMCTIL